MSNTKLAPALSVSSAVVLNADNKSPETQRKVASLENKAKVRRSDMALSPMPSSPESANELMYATVNYGGPKEDWEQRWKRQLEDRHTDHSSSGLEQLAGWMAMLETIENQHSAYKRKAKAVDKLSSALQDATKRVAKVSQRLTGPDRVVSATSSTDVSEALHRPRTNGGKRTKKENRKQKQYKKTQTPFSSTSSSSAERNNRRTFKRASKRRSKSHCPTNRMSGKLDTFNRQYYSKAKGPYLRPQMRMKDERLSLSDSQVLVSTKVLLCVLCALLASALTLCLRKQLC